VNELRNHNQISTASLTDEQFDKLSKYITSRYGIKLPAVKKVMLQTRLRKRLTFLGLDDYGQYIEYLNKNEKENEFLIIEVSTNKTDMFREEEHFNFIKNEYLPEYIKENLVDRKLKIWSAGCSSGEEVYTIAITIEEFIRTNKPLNYSVFGTDISTKVVKKANSGIYKEIIIADIPFDIKKRYYLRSKDKVESKVRVKSFIRNKVDFASLNLMDKEYKTPEIYDIIFCRNVLIYFDKELQEVVISRLLQRLRKGGLLFIGHSESLLGMDLPVEMIKPTLFRKI